MRNYLLILFFSITSLIGSSQEFDPEFRLDLKSSHTTFINAMLRQDDGKIILAGSFYFVNGVYHSGVIRLNSDLTLDETFSCPIRQASIPANAIAIQPDGKIILGGSITLEENGDLVSLIRINPDGSIDNTFTSAGISFLEISIDVNSEGKIYISGQNSQYEGDVVGSIFRLLPDGSLDESYSPINPTINGRTDIQILDDDKLLMAGVTFIDGVESPSVIRLNDDGSLDETFEYPYPELSHTIRNIHPVADNKFILVGISDHLTDFYGVNRINSDGSVDDTFSFTDELFVVPYVSTVQSDGKVLVGTGVIYRINADGTEDAEFQPIDQQNSISLSIIESNNKILTGRAKIFNEDGQADETTDLRISNLPTVSNILPYDDESILIAGSLSSQDGDASKNIIKVSKNGVIDPSFNYDGSTYVTKVEPFVDGKFIVLKNSGDLDDYVTVINPDGSIDESFDPEPGFNGTIRGLISDGINKMYLFGGFHEYNDVSGMSRIVRFNQDGSLDTEFVFNRQSETVDFVAMAASEKVL